MDSSSNSLDLVGVEATLEVVGEAGPEGDQLQLEVEVPLTLGESPPIALCVVLLITLGASVIGPLGSTLNLLAPGASAWLARLQCAELTSTSLTIP